MNSGSTRPRSTSFRRATASPSIRNELIDRIDEHDRNRERLARPVQIGLHPRRCRDRGEGPPRRCDRPSSTATRRWARFPSMCARWASTSTSAVASSGSAAAPAPRSSGSTPRSAAGSSRNHGLDGASNARSPLSHPTIAAADAWRLLHGTPSIPALYAARPGLQVINEVGIDAIREKSQRQTQRLLDLAARGGISLHDARATLRDAAAPSPSMSSMPTRFRRASSRAISFATTARARHSLLSSFLQPRFRARRRDRRDPRDPIDRGLAGIRRREIARDVIEAQVT